ncbi:MAG: hypothetical protein M3348_06660 [Acidobacteriota bacterium]|nr:hypothetical protein [Acidobacteriota bacterium]
MNKAQRVTLIVGLLLCAAMFVFPPRTVYVAGPMPGWGYRTLRYGLLWHTESKSIETSRLGYQFLIVTFLTCAGMVIASKKRS